MDEAYYQLRTKPFEEKHAFTGKEVALVIDDLQQEFAPAALRAGSAGEG